MYNQFFGYNLIFGWLILLPAFCFFSSHCPATVRSGSVTLHSVYFSSTASWSIPTTTTSRPPVGSTTLSWLCTSYSCFQLTVRSGWRPSVRPSPSLPSQHTASVANPLWRSALGITPPRMDGTTCGAHDHGWPRPVVRTQHCQPPYCYLSPFYVWHWRMNNCRCSIQFSCLRSATSRRHRHRDGGFVNSAVWWVVHCSMWRNVRIGEYYTPVKRTLIIRLGNVEGMSPCVGIVCCLRKGHFPCHITLVPNYNYINVCHSVWRGWLWIRSRGYSHLISCDTRTVVV